MAGPGDELAAVRRGDLRVSHADRERVIGTLKAAFVQGLLVKNEFELRVGQALVSRTYAELAAVTADLPAGLSAARLPEAARPQSGGRGLRPGLVLMVGTVVYAVLWLVAFALPDSGPDHDPHAGIALAGMSTIVYLIFSVVMLELWQDKRSARQLPGGPALGGGGQAPPSLSSAERGSLPSAGPGRRPPAEAAPAAGPRLLPSQ